MSSSSNITLPSRSYESYRPGLPERRSSTHPYQFPEFNDEPENDPESSLREPSMHGSYRSSTTAVGRLPPETPIFDIPAINRPGRTSSYTLQSVYPTHHNVNRESQRHEYIDVVKEPSINEVPEGVEEVKMSLPHEVLFIGVVAVSHLMTQAALGQALAPISIIAADFGTNNPGEMSWFIAGYSLTVGTFILISGRLGDILGHKRVFAFGYAWFGVWSGFAGFSIYPGRQIFFDICRAMQGIGPALLMPNALALFGRAYPAGIKKNIVFSIFGALAPAGFVIGATSGSFFSQVAWWPWAFWSFGITCLGLAVMTLLVIPRELSILPKNPPGFDATGSVFAVLGLVLVNVAFNNAPMYGWGKEHVFFLLIIGLVCLGAFILFELRAPWPLLPLRVINSTSGFALSLVGLGWGAFGVWVFYLCRFLEVARSETPLTVSAQFSPAVICGLLAAGLTGFLLTHAPVSFVMMISMLAFLTGIVIITFMPVQQSYWAQTFLSILIMPFGMDMSFPAATIILSNSMPREHQGLAASLVNTVVNYSISIALGIAGTVEVNVVKGHGSLDEFVLGWRCAMYTAMALAGAGTVLGAMFFTRTYVREGWKVMDH